MVAIPGVAQEVPLPPPQKPEREERRSPEFERATVVVDAASVWVADVHRRARDFARRHGDALIALTLELVDGSRVPVGDLQAGPGEGFVTLSLDDRELGVRLDRIAAIELTLAGDEERAFRIRGGDVGFAGSA
ncbi:MAG TPA: hypothetical protein VGJ77_03350 [Gaiellaceae bacterium]|jgi:hypothetical protein